jgi:hypothetical protein
LKIGYLHSVPFPSGKANVLQVVQICRAFAQCGHDVTLFIPRAEQFTNDDEALAAAREIHAGELPFRIEFAPSFRLFGRFAVLGTVRETLAALKRNKPDVTYTRNPWSGILNALQPNYASGNRAASPGADCVLRKSVSGILACQKYSKHAAMARAMPRFSIKIAVARSGDVSSTNPKRLTR